MARFIITALGACGALFVLTTGLGARQHAAGGDLRITPVQGQVHMIGGAGGNVVVQAGDEGVVVVDTGGAGMTDALLAAIRQVSPRPILYVLNTGAQPEHIGGNGVVRFAGTTFTGGNATNVAGVGVGAAVMAHENALLRMSAPAGVEAPTAPEDWPTETFFVRKHDLYLNDEPIELIHFPGAVTDGNVVIHFRRSDVVATGDIFRHDGYPAIDVDGGGSIQGTLDALNGIIDITVPKILQEGGTMVVPGHGRIGDESDVVVYRDMLTIIRDRVADLVRQGHSLDQVRAARPTLDYDGRWGSGGATPDQLIEAVYRSLVD